MPRDPNILQPEWDHDRPEPPFRARVLRVGAHAGAQELGATLYELAPGGAMAPYHTHHANEEMLIVLSGRPELRVPEGRRRLEPGAVVSFPRGDAGAHRVTNPGDEPARVLMLSTMRFPDVAEYPDTGALLAVRGAREGKFFPGGTDVPLWEAVMQAMEAAAEQEAGRPPGEPTSG